MKCENCQHGRPHRGMVYYCDLSAKYVVKDQSCLSFTNNNKTVVKEQQNVVKTIMPELYKHQKQALEMFQNATELPIFAEAGCGKSAIILRHISKLDIEILLIIAPNKVHNQWCKQEVPKWLSDKQYTIQTFGGHRGRRTLFKFVEGRLNIVCVNVETFSTKDKWEQLVEFVKGKKHFIVLDEATSVKNINALRTQRILYAFNDTVKKGNAILKSTPASVGRAVLTGTPITSKITNIWSIMEFLKPNFFGKNFYAFKSRYSMTYKLWTDFCPNPIDADITAEVWASIKSMPMEQAMHEYGIGTDTYNVIASQTAYEGCYKHIDEIKSILDKCAFFCKLKDCVDMPEQTYTKRIFPMTGDQLKAYRDLEEEMIVEYKDKICTVSTKLVLLIRLQQISSGFMPVDLDADEDIKDRELVWFKDVQKLKTLYSEIEECAKPVIIITRFTAEANKIYDDLAGTYNVNLQTGTRKVGSIEDFQNNKNDIMIANIRVISKGFNLQNAHQMIYYSNTFSLEDRIQSEGRIFRIGQKNICNYIDLINEDTVDMKVVAALRQNKNLLDYMMKTPIVSILNEWDELFDTEYGQLYK